MKKSRRKIDLRRDDEASSLVSGMPLTQILRLYLMSRLCVRNFQRASFRAVPRESVMLYPDRRGKARLGGAFDFRRRGLIGEPTGVGVVLVDP